MRQTKTSRYLKTFFDEKGIDAEESFELTVGDTWHLFTYGVVIEAIKGASAAEQDGVANMLRRIDFKNGDVKHYLRHLANGLAASRAA